MKISTLLLLFSGSVTGLWIPFIGSSKRGVVRPNPKDTELKTTADVTENSKQQLALEEDFEEYSRCLSPKEERDQVLSEGDEYALKASLPVRLFKKVLPKKTKRGNLILCRAGLSTYMADGVFTGWKDPDLTAQGIEECKHAGRLMLAEGYEPDVVYTSRLQRAVKSTVWILEEIDALFLPVFKTYRLNQRMYGALQGLSKKETAKEFGADVVQAWRTSLKARPPPLKKSDPSHPIHDRRYSDLPEDLIPSTESLLDCQERARPLWDYKIRKDIENGKNVLVVGHKETLRGLVKVIDGIPDNEITDITIPYGMPFVYKFDEDMNPIMPTDASLTQVRTSASFLEKPGLLQKALKRQKDWTDYLPGLGEDVFNVKRRRDSTLKESIDKLRMEQDLIASASINNNDNENDEAEEQVKLLETPSPVQVQERWTDDPSEFEEYDFFAVGQEEGVVPTVVSLPPEEKNETTTTKTTADGPFVVLIRHGRTPHNNLGLFTGWEDPPLAEGGVEDAKNAGRLLKRHGYEFDVVYTSWLTRAIQTAYHVIDELDSIWLPIVKSWRLNERMYGDLTGKSKKMVANEYGEDQLVKWRRGFKIRPPATSSYSLSYPGNDVRRSKHFKDIRISLTETINRSVEQRKLVVHRKFPKTESLKDCMDRSIPFYTERIREEAVDKGKRVLITSHENAIRGILMHLCDIPQDAMNQLHLPNGLPLVYNVRGRCITLLDDGSGKDPMEAHDFGPAAKYLFRPCELDDEFFESMLSKAST